MITACEEISDEVKNLLKGSAQSVAHLPVEHEDFLCLKINSDIICFTQSDDPEKDFSDAIGQLKELYLKHPSDWAHYDIALVFCLAGKRALDELCLEIEQDPYFCRKFVIDLNKDLKHELSRLPFTPLQRVVEPVRPITAQAFLKRQGRGAEFARSLAVLGYRSKYRIMDMCLKGKFGKPSWPAETVEEFYREEEEPRPRIRLKELEIENFRAYRKNCRFDLDADIVVLFGPNGLGKTSFFDAIDFACTGGVARLSDRLRSNPSRLEKALIHLDASGEESHVRIKAQMIEGPVARNDLTIERCVERRKKGYLNGDPLDRSTILMRLAGLPRKPQDLGVENFVRLFRATHFFGQEFQSLTSEFRDDSRLSEALVSRMLALQDYVEAIRKAGQVTNELRKRVEKEDLEIERLESYSKSIENEIEQLEELSRISEKPKSVERFAKQLAEKIVREKNFSLEIPEEISPEALREWRAAIQERIIAIDQELKMVEEVKPEISELKQNRQTLEKKKSELAQKKETLARLQKDYVEKENKKGEIDKELSRKLSNESSLSLVCENMSWLLEKKEEYEQVKGEIAEHEEKYHVMQIGFSEIVSGIEKLNLEKTVMNEKKTNLLSEIEKLERISNEFDDFQVSVPRWLEMGKHKDELKSRLLELEQQYKTKKKDLQMKRSDLKDAVATRATWKRQVDHLQESQSELITLLDRIEPHITTRMCPVCGTSHETQEELIEKLRMQRGKQPKSLTEALETLRNYEATVNELQKQDDSLERDIERIDRNRKEIQEEISLIQEEIETFAARAIDLGIPTTTKDVMARISSLSKETSRKLNVKRRELSEQESKEQQKEKELLPLLKRQESMNRELQDIESKKKQLESLIEEMRAKASHRQVSLELEKKTIQADLKKAWNSLGNLQKETREQQIQSQRIQEEISYLDSEIKHQKEETHELDEQASKLVKSIEKAEYSIEKFSRDLDAEQLLQREALLKEEQDRLSLLFSEISNFEISFDVKQMSASLAKEYERNRDIERQISEKSRENKKIKEWHSYFSRIERELRSIRDKALNEYTAGYGPLASTIQKRLRSVYGFGEMELHPEKGGIMVKVERRGERGLFPSDFFSASQINIAALSLFLSSVLTQTWSSFTPIFLDDPVTHFDDLNAYAFLDFIKGLVMSSKRGEGYQFIISTCEKRLFQLMRQKFGKLDGRAIFYEFKSIGEDGPDKQRLEEYATL